ncbi:unnamed protein product [Ranitomeya imitator]|uniref:C3H1-type domain-containing protein n=1 Tax=Ranitomeya imitator TaxID=111125 RepID=A0ABN9KVN3_9NEOB|nr:unnamed protein product [Ranitomeya imitator]
MRIAVGEPHAKKIKLDDTVGNQDEQRMKLEQQRLCPSIVQECPSKCFFGDKCKFLHNTEKYMLGKHEDIGPHCYLYETLANAKAGSPAVLPNLTWEGKVLVSNSLLKELQIQLHTNRFLFEKSERYLKLLNKS